jgi:nucleotide-binding universal stress UspA family protein
MPHQIKKILVPVDFTEMSESAALQGAEMAKLLEAEVYLLHVIPSNGHYSSLNLEKPTPSDLINKVEDIINEKMTDFKNKILKKSGISAKTTIYTGNIVNRIIEFSHREKIDQIIMGTHGASGYKEMFIGSNAQRVVTLSEIPVLTMLDSKHESVFKNILIPIDDSIHSREKVNIALKIAKLYKSKIHILGLVNSNEKKDTDKMHIRLESVEKFVTHESLSFVTSIEHGDSMAKTAINYAEKNQCDLIVINTGHESRITGIFLGAFAQQIVNHSVVPVLSVKHAEGRFSTSTF